MSKAVVTDEQVKAAKAAYGEAFLAAGFKGYIADEWMRAALEAALSPVAEAVEPEQKPVLGYCTDCESSTEIHDGRCGCGSGRVYASPVRSAQEAEAARIGDAVLSWLVKYDLADAGNEYRAEDVIAILNDITPYADPPGGETATPGTETHQ